MDDDDFDPDVEDEFDDGVDPDDSPDPDLEPDDAIDPDDEPDEPDEDDEPPAKPARKPFSQRVAEVAEREVAKRLEAYQAEQRALAQRQQSQAPRETPEQLRERIANMDQVQFAEYMLQQQNAANANLQFQMQEAADRSAYAALKTTNPIAAKLEKDVEDRLAQMRAAGTTAPRETVLRWVIGDRALANAGRATGKAKKSAAANREAQQARPSNSRGDAAPSSQRGETKSARDKRLENIQL